MTKTASICAAVVLLTGTLAGRPASAQATEAIAVATMKPVPAAQTRSDERGQVIFTTVANAGQVHLVAEAPGIRVHRTTTEHGVSVRIQTAGDAVLFEASRDGNASLTRKDRAHRITRGQLTAEDVAAVQSLTAGSTALQAFGTLAGALEDSSRPEAFSLVGTYALVAAVNGNPAPARALIRKARAAAAQGIRAAARRVDHAEQPLYCWVEYSTTVYGYALDLQQCWDDNAWNPIVLGACSFQWLIQVELAWFWVISCSGGLIVG